MIVYKITNLVDGKIYVGQTRVGLERRFNQHSRSDTLLGRAIRKYGKKNFKREILETCETLEELNEREKFWIKKFNCQAPNGYNLMEGGEGGWVHSSDVCKKISETMTGSKQTEKHRLNSSIAQKKRWERPEEHEKASAGQRKRYEDPAEREKTSEALKKSRRENPISRESRERQAKSLTKYYEEHYEMREHLSEMTKEQFGTEESREKHSELMKKYYAEHPVSEETRKKHSESMKAYWARKREEKKLNEEVGQLTLNFSGV